MSKNRIECHLDTFLYGDQSTVKCELRRVCQLAPDIEDWLLERGFRKEGPNAWFVWESGLVTEGKAKDLTAALSQRANKHKWKVFTH